MPYCSREFPMLLRIAWDNAPFRPEITSSWVVLWKMTPLPVRNVFFRTKRLPIGGVCAAKAPHSRSREDNLPCSCHCLWCSRHRGHYLLSAGPGASDGPLSPRDSGGQSCAYRRSMPHYKVKLLSSGHDFVDLLSLLLTELRFPKHSDVIQNLRRSGGSDQHAGDIAVPQTGPGDAAGGNGTGA